MLDDYVEVRPDRAERLAAALRDGALEAGPWYVLADELIPSGEALVETCSPGVVRSGASARTRHLCCTRPTHSDILPRCRCWRAGSASISSSLWRGYGGARWPAGDTVRWRATDGAEAMLYHLPPDGYEFGNAPAPPTRARRGALAARVDVAGARARARVRAAAQRRRPPRAAARTQREAVSALAAAARPALGALATLAHAVR